MDTAASFIFYIFYEIFNTIAYCSPSSSVCLPFTSYSYVLSTYLYIVNSVQIVNIVHCTMLTICTLLTGPGLQLQSAAQLGHLQGAVITIAVMHFICVRMSEV